MAIKVLIPTTLQKLTNGQSEVELCTISSCCDTSNTDTVNVDMKPTTVIELIEELNTQYPGIKERLCDENGKIRRFINIYVNGEDIRFLQGQETKIENNAEVSIVPAVAGG